MKILILKPSSLGDVIHALPVLRLLKQHKPAHEVFWWIESGLAPLLEDDPDLTGVFEFNRKRWHSPRRWPDMVSGVLEMRRHHFDLAIDLQGLARSATFSWLADADATIGLDNPREGRRECARAAYDLLAPHSHIRTHAVDRYLKVLPLLDVPVHEDFEWLPRKRLIAERLRHKWKTDSARWVMMLPGARWNNKRWPVEYFEEVARKLLGESPDLRIGVLGAEDDRHLGERIARADGSRCVDLTGRTSLPEMIEWIRLSALVITNDTGPMHVAAAIRKPVIAVFGPTDPEATGPYGQRRNVLQSAEPSCVPCLRSSCNYPEPLACLRSISPGKVFHEAKSMLNGQVTEAV